MEDEYVEARKWIGRVVAGYKLTSLLGIGAMARVYAAQNVSNEALGRALKIVRPELASQPQFRQLMKRESTILDQLHHENIVRFFSYSDEETPDGPVLTLVLEHLRGISYDRVLTTRQAQKPTEVLNLLRQMAAGGAAAHKRGIVHRDLKPENLFVVEGPPPALKILDFGIARAADDSDRAMGKKTRDGMVRGTPGYMAPEVVVGGAPTPAADVYAMGIIAMEALLGHHPLDPTNKLNGAAMMAAHTFQPLPPLDGVEGLSPALARVIETACARKVEERYPDAMALADALQGLDLGGDRVSKDGATATKFETPALRHASTTSPTALPLHETAVRRRTPPWQIAAGVGIVSVIGVVGYLLMKPPPIPGHPAPAEVGHTMMPGDGGLCTGCARWVRINPPPEPVPLGLNREDVSDEVSGYRPSRPEMSPTQPFEIQSHEVTAGAFGAWCASHTGCTWTQPPAMVPTDAAPERLPATGVSWTLARQYCQEQGGTLPTEAQWEYAARGAEGRPYPWGAETLDLARTHAYAGAEGRLAEVGTHDQDVTPEGIYDLMGNANEWTLSLWRLDRAGDESWVQAEGLTFRGVRGLPLRAVLGAGGAATAACRNPLCATGNCPEGTVQSTMDVGFRCVRRPAS